MKIAILTIYDSVNCGNFWQAYSLQNYLENLGHEVIFIKWKSENIIYRFVNATKSKNIMAIMKRTGTFLAFKKAWKNLNIPTGINVSEKFDLIIIGSDELWNINNYTFSHSSVFYGIGLNSSNIVSYAVSLAQTEYIQIKDNPFFLNLSQNINKISVRDKHSLNVLENIGVKALKVADPTLLINFQQILKSVRRTLEYKYVLVYLFSATKDQQKFVNQYAHKFGYKTVSMCMYNQWCDINLSVGPYEFLDLINNAEVVVSGTFHGTIFSVLFHKKFVVLSSSQNKINDFLESVELEERVTPTKEVFMNIINKIIDYDLVDYKINVMRKSSYKYLSGILN